MCIFLHPGLSVKPHRCPGCHNPETWDFDGGKEYNQDVQKEVLQALEANGVDRPLCIMGGEPLCDENLYVTTTLILEVLADYPDKQIYVWTGYTYDEIQERIETTKDTFIRTALLYTLEHITCLIDGRYEEDKKDLTLLMRGSSNQNIIYFD